MSRFYVPPNSVTKGLIHIRGRQMHHARDVMRLKVGDEITVFDGSGNEYTGVIDRMGRDEVVAKIGKSSKADFGSVRLALAQAIPKSNKMDLIVEKASELGAERIIPIITSRTIVRLDAERAGQKLERWKKIAVEASKQCGRVTVPQINEVEKFEDSLSRVSDYELAIIPSLCGETVYLGDTLKGNRAKSALVYIGPEGDFTDEEIDMARSRDARPVSLGREVLRSETAAIAVLSVLNYELRWQ